MRLALKSILALLAAYLILLAAIAFWMDRQLRSMATATMEETARLIGREVAVAMTEVGASDLLDERPEARRRLLGRLQELTASSQVVRSVAVVDRSGRVLASDEFAAIGSAVRTPAELFRGRSAPVLESRSSGLFGSGEYRLFVPLARVVEIEGYLQMSLASARISELFGDARQQLWAAMVVGLLAIGILGFVLHLQLSRRGEAIAQLLEGALEGEVSPRPAGRDEFARAFQAAGRLGHELSEAREETTVVRRRFRALSQALETGVFLVGPAGELDFANPEARRLLGLAESDSEARWREVWGLLVNRLRGPAGAQRGDLDLAVGDDLRRLRFQIVPLDAEGVEGSLVVVRDRGVVEGLESDLRLAAHLRGLARLFLAVAHDLRAPLNAIVLNLELLKESLKGLEGPQREARLRYLGVVSRELDELHRALQSLLSYAAPSDEFRARFDLRGLVEDLAILLEPQARRQRVELDLALPEVAVHLEGHRDRLKQALLNLALNALEAMQEGGRLGLSLQACDGRARLAVQDTGGGIPPEILDRIWDMSFTTKGDGSGVGLYVARSVVESFGGTIRAESEPGEGTCFVLDLPTAVEEQRA